MSFYTYHFSTQAKVRQIEAKLAKWHWSDRVSKLFATVPGVGIMGASAIAANVSDPNLFRSGRVFAAWLGMTPRQNSSGGKERLGRTSKRGDKYIRCLLVAGAVAILRHARNRATKDTAWVRALLAAPPEHADFPCRHNAKSRGRREGSARDLDRSGPLVKNSRRWK